MEKKYLLSTIKKIGSSHGMKVRGIFKTREEAQERLDKLKELNVGDHTYICETGGYIKAKNTEIKRSDKDKLLNKYLYQEMMDTTYKGEKIKWEIPTKELFKSLVSKLKVSLEERVEKENEKTKRVEAEKETERKIIETEKKTERKIIETEKEAQKEKRKRNEVKQFIIALLIIFIAIISYYFYFAF